MLIEKTEIPPRGWNSFDCYMGGITEEQALANLEIFLKKLKPHGYEYFCLDAGWYADGDQKLHEQRIAAGQFRTLNLDEFGRYIPSPVNFPHGLRALADRCHENGIKFGLHMMRGLPLGAVERNTPVKDTPYHARDIYDPDGACSWCQYWVAAKADHPGTPAFYKSEVEYLTEELEVDFIKLDDVVEHPDHAALFGEAVASVPRPVLLSLSPGGECCRENWETLEKYGNMVRITSDAWDHDDTNLQKLQRWYEFQDLSSDSLRADLDMLPLGALQVTTDIRQSRLTPRGKRVMMTIMALSGSPLIFGGDRRRILILPRILPFLSATPGVFPAAGFHSSTTSTSADHRTAATLRTAGSAFSARASFRVTSFFLHRILAFPSFPLCASSGAVMRLPRPSTAMRNFISPHTTWHFSGIEVRPDRYQSKTEH
mgnify:CR=1 FL=1